VEISGQSLVYRAQMSTLPGSNTCIASAVWVCGGLIAGLARSVPSQLVQILLLQTLGHLLALDQSGSFLAGDNGVSKIPQSYSARSRPCIAIKYLQSV